MKKISLSQETPTDERKEALMWLLDYKAGTQLSIWLMADGKQMAKLKEWKAINTR